MEVETQSFSSFDLNSDRPPFSSCFGAESSLLRSPKSPENDVFQPPVSGDVKCDGSDSSVSAAMRVQKFYRGYRTRRLLADSAVVAEELWWRAIDFARLNHTTISFFNFMKPETASSRWNRISSNASKVGKGLSKDAKAQKLAFQHWIEAIDPRHRYGHSLHLYYEEWCKADSGQPFFYWLDIGDGKEVNLPKCPRSKLRQQCIKYLGPQEREHYEYVVVEGKIVHQQTGEFLDTNNPLPGAKWIFVMSTSKRLYAGEKKKGVFHHSSFLAGGTTLAAGRLVVENGTLKCLIAEVIWDNPQLSKSKERINKTRLDFMTPDAHGMCTRLMLEAYPKDYIDTIIGELQNWLGHYRPTDEILNSFLSFLKDNGVNLDQIEIHKANEDYEDYGDNKSNIDGSVDSHRSDILNVEDNDSLLEKTEVSQTEAKHNYRRTLSGGLKSPKAEVPKTAILQRINSKKAAKSYQLGNQLTLKWSTGVGPRIGCIADYPVELRLQALEFTNLSPRTPPTPSAYIRVGDFVLPLARTSPRTTTADRAVSEN